MIEYVLEDRSPAELGAVENLIRATNDFLDIAVNLLFTPGDLIGIR